ncbi:MAG: two pore domain potassium channel family protein [Chloroflexaceae bacterium]|nr:two pore domain potassium channel family protein [Chloroflexaceae bacterium]
MTAILLPRSRHTKYRQLLITLGLRFIASPFLEGTIGDEILSFMLFYAIILTVYGICSHSFAKKYHFWLFSAVASVAFVLESIIILDWLTFGRTATRVVILVIYSVYLAAAIAFMSWEVMTARRVDRDLVRGGICIYLLIGFLWALLYSLLQTLDSHAFSPPLAPKTFLAQATYFSFTTFTTLGMGTFCLSVKLP